MEVVVDGRTGLSSGQEGTTFKAVFESVRRTASSRRRVIVSVVLDGEVLSPERQGMLADRASSEFGLLEIRTIDPIGLSLETLTGLLAHVKNMERTQAEAGAAAESGEYAKALEKFDAVFNGWDILLRAVRDVGALSSADFREMRAGGDTVEVRIRELQDALVRFSASLEYKDVPAITDIIANELTRALGYWREVVEGLSKHVAKVSGVSAP
ncbi:MAG TPA: hypothetical protein VF950_06600 [Planctomycetota bacterium]